ncbi:hypothetical protein [Thioclava atlantica]|uniref:hypothetical protein n=1 Tax=Thioclava atlantica TaxID=1317124 RepID=UPI000A4A634E|nr:hypothetical protein [Thioclava atlantica]
MKRPAVPGPRWRAEPTTQEADPPLSLRDIVEALCAPMAPGATAFEIALDRIEGARR